MSDSKSRAVEKTQSSIGSSIEGGELSGATGSKQESHASVTSATAVLTIGRLFTRGSGVLKLLLIGRLLSPHDWGVFGAAVLVMSLLAMFTGQGLETALIQKRGNIDRYLPTAWVAAVVRGIVVSLIAVAAAELFSGFVGNPAAAAPMRWIALAFAIRGFSSLANVYWTRRLRFSPLVAVETLSAIADVVVTGLMIWQGYRIAALVGGHLASSVTATIGSYAIYPHFTGFRFRWTAYRKLRRYGFWVMSSTILTVALIRGAELVIGLFLPPSSLGRYQVAGMLAVTPTLEFSKVMSTVGFPALSRWANDPEKRTTPFLRLIFVIASVVMYPFVVIFCVPKGIVELTLSSNWSEASVLLPGLTLWGASRGMAACYGALFDASGKPKVNSTCQLWMLVVLALAAYPMLDNFGEWGLSVLMGTLGVFGQLIRIPAANQCLTCGAPKLVKTVVAPYLSAAIAISITAIVFGPEAANPTVGQTLIRVAFSVGALTLSLLVVSSIAGIPLRPIFEKVLGKQWKQARSMMTRNVEHSEA